MRIRAAAALLAVGCYDPAIGGGGLRCSVDGECPGGYHCDRDSSCWKDGESPPPVVPGAPRLVEATSGVRSATVHWFMPASDGGSAIVSYRVTAAPGGASVTAPAGSNS